MALLHFFGVLPHFQGTVLCTQIQLLRRSVCYANRILGQGNNAEGETVLTCIEVQYGIESEGLCRWCITLRTIGFLEFVHRPEF
jgi:hypothetical protein